MSIVTKILIVVQLVAALVLAVLVTTFVHRQEDYRRQLANAQNAQLVAQSNVGKAEAQLALLQSSSSQSLASKESEIARLQGEVTGKGSELASLRARIAQLESEKVSLNAGVVSLSNTVSSLTGLSASKDKQLDELRPANLKLVSEKAELGRKLETELHKLELAEKTIRTLQENLATQQAAPAVSISGERAPVTAAATASINGRVRQVQTINGRCYVSISLGGRDGVQQGTRFTIYRNSGYVGDAVIERVSPDEAVGLVTISRTTVVADDLVISGSKM